jgi:4-hydroxybenzoyl-CoA thioesterase
LLGAIGQFPARMSEPTNTIPLNIEWAHCDPAGIVFNSRFFEFFDTGAWMLLQTLLGIPRNELSERYGLVGFPLVESGATFTSPLKFGDAAMLESTITDLRRSSFAVRHRIIKDGKVAIEGLEKRVWAGPHPDDPMKMRAIPIPDDVLARLKSA